MTLSYDSYLKFFNELISKFSSLITFQLIVLCVELLLPYFSDLQKRVQMEFVYRAKFLTKLWCCVGGKYNKIIWFHQLG